MKAFLLILGIALLVIGTQDAIRILLDNNVTGVFSWVPGGFTLHIALDVAIAVGGAMLAGYASRMNSEKL